MPAVCLSEAFGDKLEIKSLIPRLQGILPYSKFVRYCNLQNVLTLQTSILQPVRFLGDLSLHLNHLIAERVSAPYWQFGTLPIGIFLSNLDSRQL